MFVFARFSDSPEFRGSAVSWVPILCFVAYVGCIVYCYRIQKDLNIAGLYRRGAWQVIVGAFFLNPFLLGFFIPISVLVAESSIAKRLRSNPPAPPSVVQP